MKPSLVIGTPVIRPWNLPKLLASLEPAAPLFDFAWFVALDSIRLGTTPVVSMGCRIPEWMYASVSTAKGSYGERHLNAILDSIGGDTWFMGLADDNTMAAGVLERLHEVICGDPAARAVMFAQKRGEYLCKAVPENLRAGEVDGGQVAFRRDLAGDLRWDDTPTCDGRFLEALYGKDRGAWRFVDEPRVTYNSLR